MAGANVEVAGESHYPEAIRAALGSDVKADGSETTVTVRLLPEPTNKHDRNAVAVWSDFGKVGYLPRPEAKRYAGVLSSLAANGC